MPEVPALELYSLEVRQHNFLKMPLLNKGMLHSVILADSVNFFSRSFSQMTRGSCYQTTGHHSMGPLSFRKQSAGRVCLGMVVMREQRVQEDLRKQKWLSAPSETLSSNAQLDPQRPRLLQQPSVCMAPYSSQRKTRTRSLETWPLGLAGCSLEVGLRNVSAAPCRAQLPPMPNKRRHILVSTGAFP